MFSFFFSTNISSPLISFSFELATRSTHSRRHKIFYVKKKLRINASQHGTVAANFTNGAMLHWTFEKLDGAIVILWVRDVCWSIWARNRRTSLLNDFIALFWTEEKRWLLVICECLVTRGVFEMLTSLRFISDYIHMIDSNTMIVFNFESKDQQLTVLEAVRQLYVKPYNTSIRYEERVSRIDQLRFSLCE